MYIALLCSNLAWRKLKCKQDSNVRCDCVPATSVSYALCRAAGECPARTLSFEDSRGSKNWRDSNLLIPLKLGRALLSSERLGISRTEPNERLGSILGHGFLDNSSKGITQDLEVYSCCYPDPDWCLLRKRVRKKCKKKINREKRRHKQLALQFDIL